ncbi:MAG: hypothetical protein LUF31_02620, partial [Fusobacterium sp.]|nr:hypothetical protein [Fusobacterium sp.]
IVVPEKAVKEKRKINNINIFFLIFSSELIKLAENPIDFLNIVILTTISGDQIFLLIPISASEYIFQNINL